MAAPAGLLLAVPNVSEGADRALIDDLGRSFGVASTLLDTHSDPVHARSVFTLAGSGEDLQASLLEGAAVTIERLDLASHSGAHPHIGTLDVCPIVYPDPAQKGAAERRARLLAVALGELGLPVFLYGGLASNPNRRERHYFRRGGPVSLGDRLARGTLVPDHGPRELHPRAGAVLVTARPPLAAFNVEVEGIGLDAGREIATAMRESGGGLAGVRAIAIELTNGRTQISTNVHDPHSVTLAQVVAEVHRRAVPFGGRAAAAELVGLVPEAALAGYPEGVPIRGFDPAARTIESRLAGIPCH